MRKGEMESSRASASSVSLGSLQEGRRKLAEFRNRRATFTAGHQQSSRQQYKIQKQLDIPSQLSNANFNTQKSIESKSNDDCFAGKENVKSSIDCQEKEVTKMKAKSISTLLHEDCSSKMLLAANDAFERSEEREKELSVSARLANTQPEIPKEYQQTDELISLYKAAETKAQTQSKLSILFLFFLPALLEDNLITTNSIIALHPHMLHDSRAC